MDSNADNRLRTLSLFSGIGGIDLALKPWCRTVCYVELDSYAQAVLAKNMANGNLDPARIWDDVRTFGQSELAQVGPIDCITGGFPCTDISNAGQRAGLQGEQSGLWREMYRTICLARPGYVFVENVAALVGRGLGTVLGDLAAGGYRVPWDCIPAISCGAHFYGERIWIVASNPSANRTGRLWRGPVKQAQGLAGWSWQQFEGLLRAQTQLAIPAGRYGRISDGVSYRVDRLRCLGNAVVPAQARRAFELLMAGGTK